MCMHSTATATAVEKSLKEEQEKRAEAERRVQLLEQKVSGEMAISSGFTVSLLQVYRIPESQWPCI